MVGRLIVLPKTFFAGYTRKKLKQPDHFNIPDYLSEGESTHSSKIDTSLFQNVVLEGMKNGDLRPSSQKMYHKTWTRFLEFLGGFKNLPAKWEDKMVMFAAHLGNMGEYSQTVSSYMSAIRYKLRKDGVEIPDKNFEIASIIRTCKLKNDQVRYRCGLTKNMTEELIAATKKLLLDKGQTYLFYLYRAIFLTAYYGMFRIGELGDSPHALKVADVKESRNKAKFLLILRSSKTHGKGDHPHTVNIPQVVDINFSENLFDPYVALADFQARRPQACNFFVFADGSPVKVEQIRAMFKRVLKLANFDPEIFDFHSYRVGRATELLANSVPFEIVKKWGNWKSDSIWKYFKI